MSGIQRRNFEIDNELEKKLQQRRTIDYFTPVGKYMITKNVFNRRRRRIFPTGLARPNETYITDLPPPLISNSNNIDMCTTFAHISTNKSKHVIHAVKWTPDARRILVSSYSGEFTLWNGLTFGFESIMQAHDVPIFSLEYSRSGKWLISGDQAGCIKFWQPNFNNVNIIGKAHDNCVGNLKFSPNDSKFVSCSDDQTLKIWDFGSASEECTLKGHHWDVKDCDWHSSLGMIVSGSKDNLVKLWDPREGGSCITTLHDFKHTVSKTIFQKGGNERLLAACSRDHSTRIFDLRMLRAISIIKSENETDLTSLSWHPVHSTLLTIGGYDGSLLHYDITKTADIETFNKKLSNNNPKEELDLKRAENDPEYVYNTLANRGAPIISNPEHSIPFAHEKAIYTMEYHPLGHMLCTAGADKSIRFWTRSRPNEPNAFKDISHLGAEAFAAQSLLPESKGSESIQDDNTETTEFSLPGFSSSIGSIGGIPGFS